MDVVPRVALTVKCLVTTYHKQMSFCGVSADTIDILRTVSLCFTKARRNFAKVQVFPGIHGSFLHFCKGGRSFAHRFQQWQTETLIMMHEFE